MFKSTKFPFISTAIFPSFSSVWISSWPNCCTAAPTKRISLPYLGPNTLKLGLIFLTNMPEASSISSISLTFTSEMIRSWMAVMSSRSLWSNTGIITRCKGCRTLIISFLRSDKTIEEICCAFCIFRSKDVSIKSSLQVGKSTKWTDSAWFPCTAFVRSLYKLSIKKGAIGALSLATVKRQVYKLW